MTWWKPPSDQLLKLQYPARLRNSSTETRAANPAEDRPLNVNDYTRLVCILAQDEDAKRALVDSQLDLARPQLDRSERRDNFLSLTIAPIFNIPDTTVSFHPPIALSGVCANDAPLSFRTGSRLMESWAGTRSLFNVAYANWSASGQNGPTNFSSFLPVAPSGDDHIPVDSRRALVLFHVFASWYGKLGYPPSWIV
jgi:hypothetical protein